MAWAFDHDLPRVDAQICKQETSVSGLPSSHLLAQIEPQE